jgi:energy-coupling factor transport system permease protein
LSAEIKIILYVVFAAGLFLVVNPTVYLSIFVAILMFLCRLPLRSIRKGWLPISLFLLFTFISNVISRNGKILLNIGPFMVTEEGLSTASLRTARVFFMIAGAKILTTTTKTEALVKAFGRILKPLERLGVPVDEFSSTMGLAISALPNIKDQITRTYRERMRSGNIKGFWERTKVISSFLFPLFIKSIQSPERFFEDDPGRKKGKNSALDI